MWLKIAGLAVAGACGAICRYGLGGLVQRLCQGAFPWGTMAVNSLGCLVFGFVWTLAQGRLNLSPEARTIVLVGFVGSFTTFSTFVFETEQLLADNQWLMAGLNVVAQLGIGMGAYILGVFIARLLVTP